MKNNFFFIYLLGLFLLAPGLQAHDGEHEETLEPAVIVERAVHKLEKLIYRQLVPSSYAERLRSAEIILENDEYKVIFSQERGRDGGTPPALGGLTGGASIGDVQWVALFYSKTGQYRRYELSAQRDVVITPSEKTRLEMLELALHRVEDLASDGEISKDFVNKFHVIELSRSELDGAPVLEFTVYLAAMLWGDYGILKLTYHLDGHFVKYELLKEE